MSEDAEPGGNTSYGHKPFERSRSHFADRVERHHHRVHTGVNPTRIVPLGPDPAGRLTPHHREQLGGHPFGDGTPPGPVPPGEEVPARGRP